MIANPQGGGIQIRIIDGLNEAIQKEVRQAERAVLFAKRACAFARLSLIPEAKRQIADLRSYNITYDARLTAWIMHCEALIHHFELLDEKATLSRLRRSLAIAVAIGEDELISANRAWIANSYFLEGNAVEAVQELEQIFRTDRVIESGTLARAGLVLADLLSWSGRASTATQWYRLARRKAVEFGDIALQSLVMFNSASFHVADLTFRQCLRLQLSESEIRSASLEVNSVVNLDKGIGQPFLKLMISVLQADRLLLEESYTEALKVLDSIIRNIADLRPQRLAPKIIAQRAWANAQACNLSDALNDCRRAEESADKCSDPDDRAVMHARLADVYSMCEAWSDAQRNEQARDEYVTKFRAAQDCMQLQTQRLVDMATRYI